ncbi:MAG: hypothetical protein AAFX55_19220 [Bacteroidota bacterium]
MKRISAFTMLEALISLILTGIIIALSYSLYTLVNKQMALFEQENTEIINYNLFNTTLKLDINRSNGFSFEGDQLILNNYLKPDIIYDFDKMAITRTIVGINHDTFKINMLNKTFLSAEMPKPPQLSISFKLLNDTITAHYFLKQPPDTVINKQLFHED